MNAQRARHFEHVQSGLRTGRRAGSSNDVEYMLVTFRQGKLRLLGAPKNRRSRTISSRKPLG